MDGAGVGIVRTIPVGIMDGVIPTMEVTGLDITVVTGTDTGIDIIGVVVIIRTTIPVQITVTDMAGITPMEEEFQGTGIIRQMNITVPRLVAEEAIILSVHGVQEHQLLPKVLPRVRDHLHPVIRLSIRGEILQSLEGIPVQVLETIVHRTEQPVRKVVRLI